jgi:hypothetical protein
MESGKPGSNSRFLFYHATFAAQVTGEHWYSGAMSNQRDFFRNCIGCKMSLAPQPANWNVVLVVGRVANKSSENRLRSMVKVAVPLEKHLAAPRCSQMS